MEMEEHANALKRFKEFRISEEEEEFSWCLEMQKANPRVMIGVAPQGTPLCSGWQNNESGWFCHMQDRAFYHNSKSQGCASVNKTALGTRYHILLSGKKLSFARNDETPVQAFEVDRSEPLRLCVLFSDKNLPVRIVDPAEKPRSQEIPLAPKGMKFPYGNNIYFNARGGFVQLAAQPN